MRTAVRVCVPGYGHFWFWLVTYKTRTELIRAQANYEGVPISEVGMVDGDEEGSIMGCFTSDDTKTHYLGIMRLYDLATDTIIHESVHAASSLAKKMHGQSRTLSAAKEEAIAYATAGISLAVHALIYPDAGKEIP